MAKARQQYFADEVTLQKENRDFAIQPELVEKLESIEAGAQVNVIETVKVNGEALTPDENKAVDVSVPLVEDTLYSTDPDKALSANQGKVLYDYIQNLASRGRYLSNWNTVTGLPTTNPVDNPYQYRAGDYYVVSNVAAEGGTNYRPNGSSYSWGVASTTVETETVKVGDYYTYDGQHWLLLVNTAREIAVDSSLSTTSTNPVENRVITNALNTKQNNITDLETIRSGAALGATALQPGDSLSELTGTSDDITQGTTNLFMTTAERSKLSNQSGVNTGDETQTTIKNKLGQASASTDGYLTSTDWNTFNNKQGTISDLETIRSNASAGKNASDTIATYGDIVIHDVNEFATASQGGKADTAIQPGDNVSELTNDAGYITDAYHDNTKQDKLIAGANIQIAADGKTISATDTTYVAGDFDIKDLADSTGLRAEWSGKQDELIAGTNIQIAADGKTISATDTKYTAGVNVSISNNNVISATDSKAEWGNISGTLSDQTDLNTALGGKQDTLIAGANIQIASDGKTISATDTTYTAGPGIDITNGVISNTQTSAEWGNITGTLSDQTDLQTALDAKQDDMVILSYGNSTWNDFITAYNKNGVVYCRASSNSNPATGSQTRLAFMAYVNNETSPTEVEFQYYRSRSNHDSAANQLDEVYVYKLVPANGGTWTVTQRNTAAKATAGTGINLTYGSGNMTIANTGVTSINSQTGDVTLTIPTVPTNVSDFVNDAGYITANDLPTVDTTMSDSSTNAVQNNVIKNYVDTQVQEATSGAVSDTAYGSSWNGITGIAPSKNAVYDKISAMDTTIAGKQNTISDLSTIRSGAALGATALQSGDNISELTNDAGFITKAVSDLTNYYTKSETYTKSEVADYVANFAGFKVVATLPTTDIKTTIIYLLGPVGSGADKYEEYIYSNNAWVKIGETSVDLTNYFNTSTDNSDSITEGSTHLFLTSAERTKLSNTSGTNTGDETKTTIQSKLGAATSSNDGYLTSADWTTFNNKQNALSTSNAGENIKISNGVISANNVFIITEDDVTVSTDDTKGVAPYNTSYGYTNIDISANAGIEWREGAIYTFVVDTEMVVASANRNVRVRIGTGDYIPVMGTTAALGGNSYFAKTAIRQFQYTTKYESGGALHVFTDSNTTYSAMSASEATTGTATTARTINASVLKGAIQTHAVNNTAYASSWNGVTTQAPSKNAVYDKLNAMDTTIGGKANDSDVVKLTGNQTIAGTKTFSTSPVVPNKTADATNTGTAIATEAQVYKKANTLDVLTKTNTTAFTPSGDYNPATKKYVDDTAFEQMQSAIITSASQPERATEGRLWYDTTNDQLKSYDGTNWNAVGKEYSAGEGISIGDITKNGRQGPAPDGFYVPSSMDWETLKTVMDGLQLTTGDDWKEKLFIPFAGYRSFSNASLSNQGSSGNYWSSSPRSASSDYARNLNLDSSYVDADDYSSRAYGYSVRCFKNNFVAPDSTWTTIQNGKKDGTVICGDLGCCGIYWNQAEGLISIIDDQCTTGYTIMDKNLGATTVYNSGDTLSEANCGKYYQRGNNYGFPRTGSVTTSSTQVDASSYGPTNPYSSSTFITGNVDWSSVHNDDLWGEYTGMYTLSNAITNTGVLSVNGQTGDVTIASPDMSNYLAKDNTIAFTPTGDYNPATKKYVDDGLGNKLDKVTTTATYGRVYGIGTDGSQVTVNIAPQVVNNALVRRTNTGQITVQQTPSADTDAASKKYVDDAVAQAGETYNAGEGITIGTYNDYSAMQGPAPSGFHVPLNTEWQAVYDVRTALGGGSSDGTNFGIALKLPFAGGRGYSSANVNSQGTYGRYRSSSPYLSEAGNSYNFNFNSSNISPQYYNYRTNGFSVRCFRNSPIIPTSSWTKLYGTSIESGGIFWSSTNGFISLSGDGQAWITIADKNLGATQTRNSGDTLSEANCGGYFQRGNNYMFPFTGTVTTSSTQVDASAYGPGNYYNSSTFITGSSSPYDWSSVQNDNLWGATTGVVTLNNAITNTGVLSVNGQTGDVTLSAGDMSYSDFGWQAKTGASITLDLASTYTPSADFTVNAPATIKDGQTYILRVNNESTAYTMTLGTNVTNPFGTDITLTDYGIDQFVFLAIGGNLELQPEGGGGGGAITADTTGTETSISKIWVGTEEEYANLGTYEENVAYMTY